MQEEIENRTVNLAISTTRLTANIIEIGGWDDDFYIRMKTEQ